MGNSISHKQTQKQCHATGKVILSDGSVHEFNKPLTAAELMLEHPQQVVVEFGSGAVSAKRPTPLHADMTLDNTKVYLMLPMKRGKPLSFSSEEARGLVLNANLILRSSKSILASSSSRLLPLFARMMICPADSDSDSEYCVERSTSSKLSSYVPVPEFDLPEDLGARPQYLSRQLSGKATWKPNLDTIKEKKVTHKKKSHWLFYST